MKQKKALNEFVNQRDTSKLETEKLFENQMFTFELEAIHLFFRSPALSENKSNLCEADSK